MKGSGDRLANRNRMTHCRADLALRVVGSIPTMTLLLLAKLFQALFWPHVQCDRWGAGPASCSGKHSLAHQPHGDFPRCPQACLVSVIWMFRTKGTALSPYFLLLACVSSVYCTCGSQPMPQIWHLQLLNSQQISLMGMQC